MKLSFKNQLIQKASGFTLIELMVAISIVAVLALIGYVLYQGAQASARDARRKQDMDAIATVLENKFNATTGTYNPFGISDFSSSTIPQDPLNSQAYVYTYINVSNTGENISAFPATGTPRYLICARLENKGGNYINNAAAPSSAVDNVPASADNTGNGNLYCRKNQQE